MSMPNMTVLTDVEESHAPPSKPVLVVSVVEDNERGSLGGDVVHLEICKFEETFTTKSFEVIQTFAVHRDLLLEALGYTEIEVVVSDG